MPKTVLITGASSGLGLSHAVYLSSKGYSVIGTSRRAEQLNPDNLKKAFLRDNRKNNMDLERNPDRSAGFFVPDFILYNLDEYINKIKFITMDITENDSVFYAVKKIYMSADPDILINNAGHIHWGSAEEFSIEESRKVFDVNYFGQIRVLKAIIPYMRKKHSGLIINTTSLASLVGIPFLAHYSACKAGMERITEALKTELAPFNINVCTLLPGDINTCISDNMIARTGAYPVPENSIYYSRSKTAWDIFVKKHIIAPPPISVSKKIEKIIKTKNPKVHYRSGSLTQALLLPVLKSMLPEKYFLKMLADSFGI